MTLLKPTDIRHCYYVRVYQRTYALQRHRCSRTPLFELCNKTHCPMYIRRYTTLHNAAATTFLRANVHCSRANCSRAISLRFSECIQCMNADKTPTASGVQVVLLLFFEYYMHISIAANSRYAWRRKCRCTRAYLHVPSCSATHRTLNSCLCT